MKRIWLGLLCVCVVCVGRLDAAMIIAGDWRVSPDITMFEIPIMITGGDSVTDMIFRVQVADGGADVGGSIDGPEITGIHFNGSIWGNAPGGFTNFSGGTAKQLLRHNVSVGASDQDPSVQAAGILATVIINPFGFQIGQTFTLNVSGTFNGDTQLKNQEQDVAVTFDNGTIEIVPEPASLTVLGVAGLFLLMPRRRL
jgi:hypothetical protein